MIIDLFKTSILRTKLKDDSLNSIILNKLEIYKKNNKSRVITNVLGFQSEDIKDKDLLETLGKNISEPIKTYLNEFRLADFKLTMTSAWINENFKHSYNLVHDHPGNHLSGVYYVKTFKNSGNIKFYRNDQGLHCSEFYNYAKGPSSFTTYEIEPEDNDLLLFPSYLKHGVGINLSDKSRISLAFNMTFSKK